MTCCTRLIIETSNLICKNLNTQAADSILYCVLSRRCEDETGKFYRFEKLYQPGNRKIKTEAARTLWIASDKAVKYYMTDEPAV